MRLTSSFAVFRFDPGEKDLAKARWLGREGKVDAAQQEYRAALRRNPDTVAGWIELFELLRRDGRHAEALALAAEGRGAFGPGRGVPVATPRRSPSPPRPRSISGRTPRCRSP